MPGRGTKVSGFLGLDGYLCARKLVLYLELASSKLDTLRPLLSVEHDQYLSLEATQI